MYLGMFLRKSCYSRRVKGLDRKKLCLTTIMMLCEQILKSIFIVMKDHNYVYLLMKLYIWDFVFSQSSATAELLALKSVSYWKRFCVTQVCKSIYFVKNLEDLFSV